MLFLSIPVKALIRRRRRLDIGFDQRGKVSMGIREKSTAAKLLASAALVAAAASVAGLGTYGTFTDSVSGVAAVKSGTVDINLYVDGYRVPNGLTYPLDGLIPGDTVERLVTLKNEGTEKLSGITLATTVSQSSALDKAMQVTIESCDGGWTPNGGSFSCGSTPKTVLAPGPIRAEAPLDNLAAMASNGTDMLKITATVDQNANWAPSVVQASVINFSFTAYPRPATSK